MKLPKIPWRKVADALLQVGLSALAGWAQRKAQGKVVHEEPAK